MTRPRTRHLKCIVMTQCVVTTRQKCVMRHENELRHYLPCLAWLFSLERSIHLTISNQQLF